MSEHAIPAPPTTRPAGPPEWTEERIRGLGLLTDLPTAASIFGLGRALAYELAKNDDFPVPVIRVGSRYRVPVAAILAALHLPPDPPT
jgi:predicted DNA-binding transcriptional regulator AlpA